MHEPPASVLVRGRGRSRRRCVLLLLLEGVLGEQLPGVGVEHGRPVAGEGGPLVALPTAQEAPVVKHILRERVQRPVVALSGVARLARDLDEAVVQREVVSDAVLPGGELVAVVGEAVLDEVADAAQRQPLVRRLEDRHGDQGDVGVGRLHHARAGAGVSGIAGCGSLLAGVLVALILRICDSRGGTLGRFGRTLLLLF